MPSSSSRRYDLVVLGAGTAGIVASTYAAGLGARVALIEQALPGGDCLFTGCVPSKSLLAAARLAHDMRQAARLGIEPVEPRVELARVMEHVQRAIADAGRPDTPEALRRRGIELVHGRGGFAAPGRIEVDGTQLSFRAAIVATGARPADPPADAPHALTTETLWDLRELPPRLAVVGAGPTGVELAQAFARLGSQVTIFEHEPRLLPGLDPDAGELLATVLAGEGVELRMGERAPGLGDYDGVLWAGGRSPSTAGLGLEAVGVETDARGYVRADSRLRTSGDRIWAAGDVLGGLAFTHVAGHQGAAAALNALLRARRRFDDRGVPRVVFTDPEIAAVGMRETDARLALGYEPTVLRHDYSESDRAIADGRARGFAKLVCDRRGRLLGALVAAPAAAEQAALLGRLIGERAKVAALAQTVHPYPTYAEGPARAAESWFWDAYLTPRSRRLLRPLLRAARALDRPARRPS